MRVDSHQHFWVYNPEEYPWIPRSQESRDEVETGQSALGQSALDVGRSLDRNFLPSDLKPLLKAAGFDGCISVQARQSLRENDFLFSLADKNDFILGVVGWIDLRSRNAKEQAAQFAAQSKAVGVRHVVQDEPAPMFMADEAFRRGIACLAELNLVYDILIYEHQLDDAVALVEAFPNIQFVVDHVAKPKIKQRQIQPWQSLMKKLAIRDNVVVKLSGMVTEADHQNWDAKQLEPYWLAVLEAFSPNRILFGSDWPVLRLASDYERWTTLVSQWLAPLSLTEQSAIWGQNAMRVYLRTSRRLGKKNVTF